MLNLLPQVAQGMLSHEQQDRNVVGGRPKTEDGLQGKRLYPPAWWPPAWIAIPPTLWLRPMPRRTGHRRPHSILADAKLALRSLIDAVRDRLGPGKGGVKEEVVSEIQQAKAKWLGEWQSIFTDPSVPTNGYRVVHDLMQVVDLDRTIALHDAGGSRGYLSPFWVATKPRNYIAMGGMAAMGWSMGAAVGVKLGRPDHPYGRLSGNPRR